MVEIWYRYYAAGGYNVTYQELVHTGLTFLQVDAFDGHLFLPGLAVGCLDHRCGSAACEG